MIICNFVTLIIFTILLPRQWHYAQCQGIGAVGGRKEVQRCTQYKKSVFEEEKEYGFFLLGAEPMKIVIDNCKEYAPFIVGGRPAAPKEFPHIARLGAAVKGEDTKWFCGGTLISEKFVMTAAHCFYSANGEINIVRLGELDFGSTTEDAKPEDFGVKRYIDHKDYREDSVYNDIGLIELDREVVFDRYKHPACLPVNNGDDFQKFLAVGWGLTSFAGVNSNQLLKVTLDRFSGSRCRPFVDDADNFKINSGLKDDSQICAGSDVARDTCYGDSGGPLLAFHNDYACMYFVVGVTSTGIGGCGNVNIPSIYTRVFNYLDWITGIVWP